MVVYLDKVPTETRWYAGLAGSQLIFDMQQHGGTINDAKAALSQLAPCDTEALWGSVSGVEYINDKLIPSICDSGLGHFKKPAAFGALHAVVLSLSRGVTPGGVRARPIHSTQYTSIFPYPVELGGIFYSHFRRMFDVPPLGVHPLVWAARVFAAFLYLHPYEDGNGRTARLLLNVMLQVHGMPYSVIPDPITSLSRLDYIACLADVAYDDMEPLYNLILQSVESSPPISG